MNHGAGLLLPGVPLPVGVKTAPAAPGGGGGDALLLENSDRLQLEDDSGVLLLEA